MAVLAFCGGSKNRGRKLGSVFQSLRQGDAADAPRSLILFPARANQVAAHNTFHGQRIRLSHEHRAASQELAVRLEGLRKLVELVGDKMIRNVGEFSKPERRELIQHFAFTRDRIRQDTIESRETVGSDDE